VVLALVSLVDKSALRVLVLRVGAVAAPFRLAPEVVVAVKEVLVAVAVVVGPKAQSLRVVKGVY
jgi:hypothetical protein